jgi:hypothetical protein
MITQQLASLKALACACLKEGPLTDMECEVLAEGTLALIDRVRQLEAGLREACDHWQVWDSNAQSAEGDRIAKLRKLAEP